MNSQKAATETLAVTWRETAKQRPTAEDASETGMVLAVKGNGQDAYVTVVKWSYCTPKAYPWWMSYPRRPA